MPRPKIYNDGLSKQMIWYKKQRQEILDKRKKEGMKCPFCGEIHHCKTEGGEAK